MPADLRVFDSITYNIPSPDGSMFVIIMEQDGIPKRIEIHIGKTGQQLRAWSTAVNELINSMLDNKIPLTTIQNILLGHTSEKITVIRPGYEIRSGPEAVGFAILRYYQDKGKVLNGRKHGTFKYR